MKTKSITIKGRKVCCRALVPQKDELQKGDVALEDNGKVNPVVLFPGYSKRIWIDGFYRPLKSKPRTAKAGKPNPNPKLRDKQSIVDMLFEVQAGTRSCRNAADLILVSFSPKAEKQIAVKWYGFESNGKLMAVRSTKAMMRLHGVTDKMMTPVTISYGKKK